MIKRTLHNAPQGAKLLAYTSLCRLHVEYAATVWDSPLGYLSKDIEMVQNKTIRFISSLRGRVSISEERANLKLETLAERRKKSRHSLLIQLLSHGENHRALVSSYEELMRQKDVNATVTRAAFRGDPTSIYAKTSAYFNSFLPRTVRELKSLIHIG